MDCDPRSFAASRAGAKSAPEHPSGRKPARITQDDHARTAREPVAVYGPDAAHPMRGAPAPSAAAIVRLGGDEFPYLMETGATVPGALLVANKVVQLIRQPIVTHALVFSSASRSASPCSRGPRPTRKRCSAMPDTAMYAAKCAGGGVQVFESADAPAAAVVSFGKVKRRA